MPSAMVVDGRLAVETTFTGDAEQEVRAWFFLAKPGEPEPWKRYHYRSPTVGRLVHPGQSAQFEWLEPVAVPDGTYQLTVWFHRRAGGAWVHLAGGDFGLPPIEIENGGGATASGPFALDLDRSLILLRPGDATMLRPTVGGVESDALCQSEWHLRSTRGDQIVASGAARTCREITLTVPSNAPPGLYRLEVTALAAVGEERHVSHRSTRQVVVFPWPF
jgi:hypothetical protein